MKKINLLDCTLRDGGYYNNWDFSKDLIQDYILSLNETGIEYIELGFRSLSIKNYMGPCAYTKDTFINSLKIPRGIKIGVMINASELISSKQPKRKLVQKLIDNKKSKISFVRFACHFKEINETLNLIKLIKNNKIKIILNIMQITERTPDEIQEVSKKISKSRVNVLYFADSMGGLSPDGIKKIIYQLKKYWKKDIGFHAHDNMGKALINAEQSVNFGVNWIDSTVSGMGRGPGNLKTEFALIQFKENLNRKVKLAPLLNLIDNRFKDLLTKYNWGSNPYYFLSGLYGIHPSFIQTMLNDLNLKPEEMLSIIENLNKNKATKFNKNLIEVGNQIYKGKTSGNWSPISIIKKKEVLILGSGPGSIKHSDAIERFIKLKKPFVIALNDQKSINEKLINLRVACNTLRLASDLRKFKKIPQPLVVPFKRLNLVQKKDLVNIKYYDYGLEVQSGNFKFYKNSAVIPNSLTICYALAIANSGKCKRIFLSGLDGYPMGDPKRTEMDDILKLYLSNRNNSEIISITPTRYKIKSNSVYSY